jgi:hypothetical protein
MNRSEEERIFTGPSPWKKAGFIVIHPGMAIHHLPSEMPTSNSGDPLIGQPRKAEREFFGGYHEMKGRLQEHSGSLSPADMKVWRDEIREQLAVEWEQLQRLGQHTEAEYGDFRDRVKSRLESPHVEEKTSLPSRDLDPQVIHREVHLSLYPQWTRVRRTSHLALSKLLDETISNFNLLAGKHKLLRERRRSSTLGGIEELPEPGGSGREYDPEPQVHQYSFSSELKDIFQAIVDVVRENERLLRVEAKFDVLRPVHNEIEDAEEVNPNKINTKIWAEMVDDKGMDEIYPKTVQELIELARKHPSTSHSSDR